MYPRKTVDQYIIESKDVGEGWVFLQSFESVKACTTELQTKRDANPNTKFRWRHRMVKKEAPNA